MEDLILKGILDGAGAFIGPKIVQFDITDRCNNNCLCCWNNSPLLGKSALQLRKKPPDELPFELIKKTILELKKLGTKELFLAGGGEPFMHPDIMRVLRLAKKEGFKAYINTNFTMVDNQRIRELVDLKIDLIHVSLLAGTPKTYALIHPNKTESVFNDMKGGLIYIAELKEKKKQHLFNPLPHINLYFVIFNKNYKEIKEMVDLAIDVQADSVEFTPIDVIPGKTDSLLMDKEQIDYITKSLKEQFKRLELRNASTAYPIKLYISQMDNFIKRINSPQALEGRYEYATVTKQHCYTGWVFSRIKANGDVNPCLKTHLIPVGNIYKNSFSDIWNSANQKFFRISSFDFKNVAKKAKEFKLKNLFRKFYYKRIGNDPKFTLGCLQSCDNLQINIDMEKKYSSILKENGNIE